MRQQPVQHVPFQSGVPVRAIPAKTGLVVEPIRVIEPRKWLKGCWQNESVNVRL